MVKTTEQITITAPIGTREKCVELGINMSFHSSLALTKEIERVEYYNNKMYGNKKEMPK